MLRCAFLTIVAILLASSPGQAVDRKPETDAAFNRYVQLSEQRMQMIYSPGLLVGGRVAHTAT
jgi:hypothetical protein